VIGFRLRHFARCVDLAVEGDERVLFASGGSRRQPYCIEQVYLRIGAQRIERALRAGDHDRLVTVNRQAEEIAGLLEVLMPWT
jgi:hypothetical protein